MSTVATPLRLPNSFEVHQLCRENTLITYGDIFEDGIYDESTSSLADGDVVSDIDDSCSQTFFRAFISFTPNACSS